MREGWWKGNYFILFDEQEVVAATTRYETSRFLPGYEIVGLRGWDDFLVRNSAGAIYTVPTVPMAARYVEVFTPSVQGQDFESDVRYAGKIKWYVHPIVFGGSPSANENTVWVDHAAHSQLVRFWNDKYRAATS